MEELLALAVHAGIRLEADGSELRVIAPQGAMTSELRQGLRANKERILELLRAKDRVDTPLPRLTPDLAARFDPFPLTDLQHAFWLGRDSALEMGSVATHLYVELDCEDLSVPRLNEALCRLIDRHDMLRAVVDENGMQRILPAVPRYEIAIDDQSAALPAEAERAALAARDALSHQVLKADRWPLFEVRVILLPSSRVRLHVSLDLLILDAWSIFLLFREWHDLYEHPEREAAPFSVSFRDYVFAEQRRKGSEAHRRAEAYWMERIDHLPPSPDLPLRTDPAARHKPRFSRRESRLDQARWEGLKARARAEGLTPSVLLLAAYSEVLARWSASPHFTLNLTVSNRLQMHEDVNRLFGDFTSVMMQEVDRRDEKLSFADFARRVQKQFAANLDHREMSGMAVMREWAKRRNSSLQAAMPVVFSSGLIWSGDEEVGDIEHFGRKVFSVSQTSQVWLDQHVLEIKGNLVFIWDAADKVFEDGVLDAMFEAYCDLIQRLADDPATWSSSDVVRLPEAMCRRREEANRTAQRHVERCMHAGFVKRAQKDPGAIAILSPERTMTYGELLAESAAVADFLLSCSIRPGQPVAVMMHKGWEQVVAVYGVLLAGGAYIPIDGDLPTKRQQDLLRIGGVRQVLTQPGVARATLAGGGEWEVLEIRAGARGELGEAHARSLASPLDQLAYVIFTSGTTGVPKGVMIDHRGAVNTIAHINRMFDVGAKDRVLAVSSLSFDLSVYDIFGLLDVGGALVIPDYRKGHDPVHWRELICQHGVTLWNSAPQLMRMLMDSFYADDEETAGLRTVLLSGDFIPLDLPDTIRHRYADAEVISLGGATEASIWSNYHRIGVVDTSWSSIPYGKALPNQTIWVYDHALRPCPDHVRGRIFLGGSGLAMGYWQDPEKTAARFITHPESGERLYDTGDLGRYAPDGNVLILGRDDGQVKIRGHRVELGEIEAVLNHHPGIKQSVVLPTAGGSENRQLVAYIELAADPAPATSRPDGAEAHGEQPAPDADAIKAYLAERLPDYMVPLHVVYMAHIPLSANGKIDHRALPVISEDELLARRERVLPRNDVEQTLYDAWTRVIVGAELSVTDSFFELGGDSMLATQLVREINAVLPFKLEMHELFENLTIEALAALFQRRQAERSSGAAYGDAVPRAASGSAAEREELLADVRAVVGAFDTLDFTPRQRASSARPGAIFLTGGTGWVGAHVLSELLSLTEAEIRCLVRASSPEDGLRRLIDNMRYYGIEVDRSWTARLTVLCGDLSAPRLGLDPVVWRSLGEEVDAIYHLGASINVVADYAALRKVNLNPLVALVSLAAEGHLKPIFFTSPMAVCARHIDGQLVVLSDERPHPDPEGLLTGYSQSKWAAEQALLAAVERGLPVKIYRCSHALPSSRNGQAARSHYTYESVLKVAGQLDVAPDWSDSGLHGVPIDFLGRLIVETSLDADGYRGIVHLENHHPLSVQDVVEILLETKHDVGFRPSRVPLDEWKSRCLEAADGLSEGAALVNVLFSHRAGGSGVDNMFGPRVVDTHYVDSRGQRSRLSGITPPEYWRMVFRSPGW